MRTIKLKCGSGKFNKSHEKHYAEVADFCGMVGIRGFHDDGYKFSGILLEKKNAKKLRDWLDKWLKM